MNLEITLIVLLGAIVVYLYSGYLDITKHDFQNSIVSNIPELGRPLYLGTGINELRGTRGVSETFANPKRQIFVPQGTSIPLRNEEKVNNYIMTNGPSIDGNKKSPKSMFVYSQNKFSLKCCPSTYSSDKGCVCTSDKQNNFISQRGSI
tara:strand:+ start:393 stop:839 length:447 start_codon:yes stop_codon:yes gene_type:complete